MPGLRDGPVTSYTFLSWMTEGGSSIEFAPPSGKEIRRYLRREGAGVPRKGDALRTLSLLPKEKEGSGKVELR